MSIRFRPIGAALVMALALSSTLQAQQDEPKTELGRKMSAMNTAFKAIGRQVEDPAQNAKTLEQIAIMETNLKAALTLDPEKKGQVPAADQAKFVADYQAGIKQMQATLEKLKAAVKAGKNADALAIIDEMKQGQRDGHREFRVRKPGGGLR